MTSPGRFQFLAGLFLATLVALAIEILNTRLLSVLTWYHLSFFAVSTAMFGMSAGALRVYLGGPAYAGANAARALARNATLFALSIPLCHAAQLAIPIRVEIDAANIAALTGSTAAMAVPFYLSGILVAIALTRIPGPSGLVYAVDLAGAAAGSLLVLPLLRALDISSAVLVCSAVAAVSATCFHVFAGTGRAPLAAACAAVLLLCAAVNAGTPLLRVVWSKGERVATEDVVAERWTLHGQVQVWASKEGRPWFWGEGEGASEYRVNQSSIKIDGAAGTVMTEWDGDPASIEWVQHDVTALPYHLRRGGDVAVVGVGGGRDLLTALWAGSRSVTGIEINEALVEMLSGPYRDYAKLVDRPEVRLVHDEARSYLTRARERFDVLQMSLIDTWAATGAGAFTLSENGLYTEEAWRVLLGVLRPDGLLSVSRWFSPRQASETSRLLALATAALLDRGVREPRAHVALVARRGVATLLVSPSPLAPRDVEAVRATARRFGFRVLLLPDRARARPPLGRIAGSRSRAALETAVADAVYDYSPPSDQRPYFFNILRPGRVFAAGSTEQGIGVVASGNLSATRSLVVLWGISAGLVALVILAPLLRSGLPSMDRTRFAHAVAYFALIGAGYMLVQIPLMQRFSVYLGHPTYAVAVILFSMILATGAGSLLSDRIPIETRPGWLLATPLGIAVLLALGTAAIQPLMDATLQLGLVPRCAIAAGFVSLAALPLGTCFPVGLRLVSRHSEDALPWMWGVNGAFGVLASVSAIGVSMWSGIHTNLHAAAIAYALLAMPALRLSRAPRRS